MDQRVTFHLTPFQNCVVHTFLSNTAVTELVSTCSITAFHMLKARFSKDSSLSVPTKNLFEGHGCF